MSKNLLETIKVNFDGPLMFTKQIEMLGLNEEADIIAKHIASDSYITIPSITITDDRRAYMVDSKLDHSFEVSRIYFDAVNRLGFHKERSQYLEKLEGMKETMDMYIRDCGIVIPMDRELYVRSNLFETTYKILGFSKSGCVMVNIEELINKGIYSTAVSVTYEPEVERIYTEYPIQSFSKPINGESLEWYKLKLKEFQKLKEIEESVMSIELDDIDKMIQMIREARQMVKAGQFEIIDGYIQGCDFIEELESLCCSVFIEKGGSPDFVNIVKVRTELDYTVNVYAGEKDSFGWLTGVLDLNDDGESLVVFG